MNHQRLNIFPWLILSSDYLMFIKQQLVILAANGLAIIFCGFSIQQLFSSSLGDKMLNKKIQFSSLCLRLAECGCESWRYSNHEAASVKKKPILREAKQKTRRKLRHW